MSDPDRSCIGGSDLLGTSKQQRCTDKPSQDVHDAVFGQDSGPRVISGFLSSLDFCGVFLWLSRGVPSFSPFLTRLLPLSGLALLPSLPSFAALSSQPLSSQTRPAKTSPRLLLVSRRCHHRMTRCSVSFLHTSHHTAHSRKKPRRSQSAAS